MFKNWKYYWLLMRPMNLGIVALTQLIFILHGSEYSWDNIRFPEIVWMVMAVMLTAAAGYVINDIFDIEEDLVNVPELRIVAKHVSIKNSKVFYAALVVLSLICAFMSSYTLGFLCLAIGVMLYYYSSDLKGTTLWGNLLVSFITGAVVFTSSRAVYTIFDGYFAEYAFLAFLISMPREIVKDIEDIEGDKTQEYQTFPIVYGAKKAIYLSLVFMGLVFASVLYLMLRHGNMMYDIYSSVFVLLPLVILGIYMLSASAKKHYSRISMFLKILMVTGLCSIFWL